MSGKKHLVIARPRAGDSLPLWFAILDASERWCDWRLIRCDVLDGQGQPAHYGEGCPPSEGCRDIEKAEPMLSGYIKWDGCMEFRTGTAEDCHVHVCDGPQSVLELSLAWTWLLAEATKAMAAIDGGARS